MKKESGFTLIELLLVLAIIGIISAIAIPALLGQRERAKAKAVESNTVAIAGECARINDQMREKGTAKTPAEIATSAVAISSYAAVKNPYTGAAGAAYAQGSGNTHGTVYLVGGTVADPISGGNISAVTITGYFDVGGAAGSIVKIVALD